MSPLPTTSPDPRQTTAEARAMARSPRQAFRHGVIQSLPFLIVIVPFSLLFGVVSSEAGLDIAQTLGFSVLVLAGASQFTALQLLTDHAPAIVVILSGLAVNLRMAMYSASLVPWLRQATGRQKAGIAYMLIDQSFALSIQHYERYPRLTMPQRMGYFFGAATALCVPWILVSWLGATLGRSIPDSIALDFAMPITFLAMIAPMLKSVAHLTACLVSITGALLLAGLPSGTGLLIAAPLGMAAGAWCELAVERRREARS
ncbi:AzlC family ABC transporter permease [Paracoccus sp. (in: a-proteobacteria)]|uniref:AzlC family ABC transporter permease n=1 Tax=Paracoccus sp. TaxID=267 RepID=UPI003A8C2E20